LPRLTPSLSPSRAPTADDRQRHESHRHSLYRAESSRVSRARGDSLLWFRLSGLHSTDGWKSIGRVFVLALVPYLILGGLVNRWARKE
jgi:hypothetical protein